MDDKIEDQNPEENNLNQISANKINKLKRGLFRSVKNRILFGVCSGLGEFFNIDPIFFRLIFILSIFFNGWGIVVYIILAAVIPTAPRLDNLEYDKLLFEADEKAKSVIGVCIILLGIYLLLVETGFLKYIGLIGLKNQIIVSSIVLTIGILFILHFNVRIYEVEQPVIFYRINRQKIIAGVCTGLAKYFNTEILVMRISFVIFTVISLGAGIVIYILFMLKVQTEMENSNNG